MELNKYIDHTLLKPEATKEQITKLCEEARQYDFASVCVNTCYVPLAKQLLAGSDVKVCCVVGFPLGAMDTVSKAFEAKTAVENGAQEVDMVIMIATMLHSIATGNLLPSRVKSICVDINPSTVTKLSDRGSAQVVGIVTDIGTFLPLLYNALHEE